MANEYANRQIIRLDGKDCFMEVLNDAFPIGKVHLGFYTYSMKNAKGSRFTNNIQIYLDIPEFLALAQEISSGMLFKKAQHVLAQAQQTNTYPKPLFETLGGTSAARLNKSGQARQDGMGISRQFRINAGTKKPYLLNAESGPGQADAKGLIVPKFTIGKGEQKVMVPVDHSMLLGLAETVRLHIQAYYSSFYVANPVGQWQQQDQGRGQSQGQSQAQQQQYQQQQAGTQYPSQQYSDYAASQPVASNQAVNLNAI